MSNVGQPIVAVVVPTRDRPEMLRRTIDAILGQDYGGPIKVVVVFDQTSPDHTLERTSDARSVRVCANAATPGLPGGRNTGIAHTKEAEYIAFCDDDDVWLAGKLTRQIGIMILRPEVRLTTTGIVIDFEGELSERPSPAGELTVESLVRNRTTEAHPSTFVFRRDALDEVGPVDEAIPGGYSEDYDFLLRIAKSGRIVCLPEPLVTIRWGRTSFFSTRWKAIVDAQRYLMNKHPEFTSDRRAEARMRGQVAFALAALGERRQAGLEVAKVIRRWPLEKRWPVAAVVSTGLVPARTALYLAHRFGRGI